jgi:hypothetical protein
MALDDNDHAVLHAVMEMGEVAETEYVDSPIDGEPLRLYVLFDSDVDVLSAEFQQWMVDAGVAVMNVGFESDAVLDQLFVEVQDVDVLA